MDISNLDLKYIRLFATANKGASYIFGIAPNQASPGKQKKIRKWLNTSYICDDHLPQAVAAFIEQASDREVMAFLSACDDYMQEKDASDRQLLTQVIGEFSQDVQEAFTKLFYEVEFFESVQVRGDKIILTLEDCSAYKRALILHAPQESPVGDFHWFDFSDVQLLKEGNGYKLVCAAENSEEETSVPVTIFFDRATTEIDVYRADRRDFGNTPWESLAFMALVILEKDSLGAEYFNQKERDLLPLLKELRALCNMIGYYDEEAYKFENLKHYIRKHGLLHLLPLVDTVTKKSTGKTAGAVHMTRLVSQLNHSACEGLWRELYRLVADSQEGYADKLLAYKLSGIKVQIEEAFHRLGYEGAYPNFCKTGALKGTRLEESYNLTYWIGMEKNARYMIHCQELLFGDTMHIQFLCGTAFLKKDETITDIYSCCFNAKGRRLFKTLFWFDESPDTLDRFVTMAAKRAECTKLTKEEKSLLGQIRPDWNYFVTMFLFTGGLFAVMMTVAAFLLCCLVTAILLGFNEIWGMIEYMPWCFIFLFSFVSFGGAMAILDITAKSK